MLDIVLDTEYISEQKELWSLFSSGRDNKVYSRFSEEHYENSRNYIMKVSLERKGGRDHGRKKNGCLNSDLKII